MAINLITRVEPKVMERLYKESVTQGLFSNQYSWAGARTIEINSVDNVALTGYDRTVNDGTAGTIGNRFGSIIELGDTKNAYTVKDEVKYNIGFEKSTNSDQNDIKTAASIISRQTREVVTPYLDMYRLRKIALGANEDTTKWGLTKTASGDLSRSKILETLMKAKAALANNFAPANQQILYVGETLAIEMKLADQVIGCDKIAEQPIVNGVIGKLAGMQLRIVPDKYMNPTTTDLAAAIANGSLTSGDVGKELGFLIVSKGCAWAPVKVKTSRVINDHPDFDGTAVQFHMYHDCFVNKLRNVSVYSGWVSAKT